VLKEMGLNYHKGGIIKMGWGSIIRKSVDLYIGSKDEKPVKPVIAEGARISSRYGPRIHPVTKIEGFHYGIDITVGGADVKIYAAYSGKIVYIGDPNGSNSKKGYGYRIIIEDNKGYNHVYAHLKGGSAGIELNKPVNAGDELGIMGNTGSSTGQHLHFGMSKKREGYGENGLLYEKVDTCRNPTDVENLYPKK
jgi:murein DD-endopeptidase MepM/ murein hydrolase activator NlpD